VAVVCIFALGMQATGCAPEVPSPDKTEPVVNFYNWFDYIGPQTLEEFTRETGIKVNYDVYDSDETLEGKLLAGNTGYDLVVPTATRFARQREAGLFHPLDWSRLANAGGLDPYLMEQLAGLDPGNQFAVPHSWGTTGLSYDSDQIGARMPDAPFDSWALIFDPDVVRNFADCGVTLLDAPADVLQSALIYMGRDPASESTTDLSDAIAVIARIRPFVRYFHSSQFVDDLANGEICLALAWSGSAFLALHSSTNSNLKYMIPKEGGLLWFEVMAIPADASHIDNAHRLIDHLLIPRVAADFTNATFYPNAVASALAGVDATIRDEPAIYPPVSVRQRLFSTPPETLAYERRRLRAWTAMKSGSGDGH
jgi:putrescine transport system substrate-binding protein